MKCDCGEEILLENEKERGGICAWCYHGLLKPHEEDGLIERKKQEKKTSLKKKPKIKTSSSPSPPPVKKKKKKKKRKKKKISEIVGNKNDGNN